MNDTLKILRAFLRPLLYLFGGFLLGRFVIGPLLIAFLKNHVQ